MEVVLVVALVVVLGWFVAAPLRSRSVEASEDPTLAGLEARRDAKYREIRDARTDLELGKIDEEQFAGLDAELRSQAIEVLDEIDAHRARGKAGGGESGPSG